MCLTGLGSILFAISIDNEGLNRILPATGFDSIISTSGLPLGSAFVPREEEDQMPVIASGNVSPQGMIGYVLSCDTASH